MSAIKRGKIYARERVSLEKVIPLMTPFSVQIDVCSACNMQCNFCFHSDFDAINRSQVKFGLMTFELFSRVIDDMKTSWGEKSIKKLRLFKIGEPLLNRDICKMIRYAKESGIAECIEITTNGTLLNEEINLELVGSGLDILNISVNGINESQYKEACNYDMDFEQFRKNIENFYRNRGNCKVFIKYSDIGYSEEEKKTFYKLFEDICDEIFVEVISDNLWQDTNIGTSVANQRKGLYGQELKKKQVCPFLFTTMVINHEGIVHLCCVDWKTEYVLGDLKSESVSSIWNGEKLRNIQILHLKKKKDDIKICQKCESLSASTIDDIDDYADTILKTFE